MIGRLVRRMHFVFRYHLTTRQRSALVAYSSFAATIVAVRGPTTAIKQQHLWAVDLALAIIASAGAYFTGIPLWRGLRAPDGARDARDRAGAW